MFAKSNIEQIVDALIETNVHEDEVADFQNKVFIRLAAKERRFVHVNFIHSTFQDCYLRGCVFDSCDFTGCRFIGSNLYSSSFTGCKFDYASFERTIITDEVLDTECPAYENLKFKFARSLRTNYQQLGDSKAANKAIKVELAATRTHLWKAWSSNESYYRKKYRGHLRFEAFAEWLGFKTLDWVWGNGESITKLFRTFLFCLVAIAAYDVFSFQDSTKVQSYWGSFVTAIQVFFGAEAPTWYPSLVLSAIIFVKLVLMGFFLSIIIKRMSRR